MTPPRPRSTMPAERGVGEPHEREHVELDLLLLALDRQSAKWPDGAEARVVHEQVDRAVGVGEPRFDAWRARRRPTRSAVSTSAAAPYASPSSFASASSRAVSRATSTRSWPRSASARANARPIPADAPVTSATGRRWCSWQPPDGVGGVLLQAELGGDRVERRRRPARRAATSSIARCGSFRP